ncbi:hypothetical protein ABZ839_16190 [Streptomyces cellulosae]
MQDNGENTQGKDGAAGDEGQVEVPWPRQLRVVGWPARGIGFVTRVAGFLTALGGANHIRTPVVFGQSYAEAIGTGILMIVGGITAVFVGAHLSRYGRRHTTRLVRDSRDLELRSYILYLRPFDLDEFLFRIRPAPVRSLLRRLRTPLSRTFEEDLILTMRLRFRSGLRLGRVVAVGRPGERLPLAGARRFYLSEKQWKPTVSAAVRDARLVVLATGTSDGTLWEFTEAVRLLPPKRLMVMVFTDEAEYDRFRSEAGKRFAARAAELPGEEGRKLAAVRWPAYPPLRNQEAAPRMVGTQGFIVFGSDWTPEFVRLDPTAVWAFSDLGRVRKVMRRQVNPVMRRVKRELDRLPDDALGTSAALSPRAGGAATGEAE